MQIKYVASMYVRLLLASLKYKYAIYFQLKQINERGTLEKCSKAITLFKCSQCYNVHNVHNVHLNVMVHFMFLVAL